MHTTTVPTPGKFYKPAGYRRGHAHELVKSVYFIEVENDSTRRAVVYVYTVPALMDAGFPYYGHAGWMSNDGEFTPAKPGEMAPHEVASRLGCAR